MNSQQTKRSRTAIVTGATGNLGRSVVTKLLAEGYHVTGTTGIHEGVNSDNANPMLVLRNVDLVNEAATLTFTDSVISLHNTIDLAVLTVGGFTTGLISETAISDITKQFELNFATAYNVARPVFIQMLKQNSGRIFLVGARPGLDAMDAKGMTAYGLSKSLVFRLAALMNEEAKGKEVFTSAIVPGTIDTPQNRLSMPDADFSSWVAPATIANIISFCCSQAGNQLREPVIRIYGNP